MCCDLSDRIDPILDDLNDLVESTEPETRPKVRAFQPFPVSELPDSVRRYAVQCAAASGYDVSFIVLPLLSALASAIGNSRRIALNSEWTEASVLWTVIVGESGTMKSPALKHALKALRKIQKARFEDYQRDCRDFESQDQMGVVPSTPATSVTPSCDPQQPKRPVAVRLCVQDTTVEALMVTLAENPRGVLLVKDELSGWFSFGQYKRGGGKDDVAHWLQMYHADQLINDRKGSGTLYIPRAAVSIAGGIQPSVLKRVIGQEHRDNGLFPRFLLAYPPRRAKQWSDSSVDPALNMEMDLLFEGLYGIQTGHDELGVPEPVDLPLASGAKSIWIEYVDALGLEQTNYIGEKAAAFSKLEGVAARIALIHFLVRVVSGEPVGDPNAVDEASVRAGIRMALWFKEETLRVYDILRESEEEADRRDIRELIGRRGGMVSFRDWQRIRSLGTSAEALEELSVLVDSGEAEWHDIIPSGGKGGRPSKGIRLTGHKTPSDTTPPGTATDPRPRP